MRSSSWFPLLFLGLPLLELYLLIRVGMLIGALWAVILVVGTALLGVGLLRWQGLENYRRMQRSLARGEMPAQELVEGAVMLAGGVLLIIPGLITDVLGLLCLFPPARRGAVRWWLGRARVRVDANRHGGNGRVYDAEYSNLPPDESDTGHRGPR